MIALPILLVLLHLGLVTSDATSGSLKSEIIRGHSVKPHSRPYMAFVISKTNTSTSCGGFLVREDFVMTAAHCQGKEMFVVLGAHNIRADEHSQVTIKAKRIIPHPEYLMNKVKNDIMLLELEQNVTLNENIKPIPLPKIITDLPEGTNCLASGWGIISEEGTQIPDTLQEANIQVVERSCCRKQWGKIINKKMLCTEEVGCVGDSGGPLVCDGMAYGITSFGIEPCGFYGFPSVYTRISEYLSWVNTVMQKERH
ncbi:duodenase-1-like [Erpetoichthys calabaricus]|uniref:duodenase-1-like n=1 Tax=Erpetoichthys calabaricus TaxID=27687 RepID=UPI002233ED97|nr:duodenase-1-like [Erpetoichthys calabaricus]